MALRFKYTAKDEIPAEHSSLYVERDGAFVLDAEGVVGRAALDEVHTTHAAVLKERDDLKRRFEGMDPEAVKALAGEKRPKRLPAMAFISNLTAKMVRKR